MHNLLAELNKKMGKESEPPFLKEIAKESVANTLKDKSLEDFFWIYWETTFGVFFLIIMMLSIKTGLPII